MEWKAIEIERLNGLLIKQANVIERLNDQVRSLKDELQWLKEGRRPIQKDHFPPKDIDREKER